MRFYSSVSSRILMVCAAVCLGALLVVFAGCSVRSGSEEAKNVILVVGDGMGVAQREAIELASAGAYRTLVMDSLPHAGLVGTNSANPGDPVTDSAAAATAMASGVKTHNGSVGVDTRNDAVPTVLERAKDAGKAVGLVTTSSVTDATPAAFAAHVDDRSEKRQIAQQYLKESRPDVILGGGRKFWVPAGEEDSEDLTKRAREQGYAYLTDRSALDSASGPRLLGLFAEGAMYEAASEGEGGSYEPTVPLPEMTQKAIEVLSEDPDGFFLLVEEEAIDAMGHEGNGTLMLEAGRALDQSVKIAKDFAEENGETLLIVVGDHECCGLAVEKPEEGGKAGPGEDGPFSVANSDQRFLLDNSTSGHTAVDVPLTAMGPGAERLEGTYENTFIHEVMAQSMGLHAAVEPSRRS
jgi:alkaline phosphatase